MRLLYIGNNLKKGNPTLLEEVTHILSSLEYEVMISSSKQNKLLRLLEMILTVIKSRKVDYVLIDTYSTINFYYALIISQLCRIKGVKYIPILHGGNLPIRLKNSRFLSKLIFDHSYINISPSRYLKSKFEEYNFVTKVIPNPIPIDNYMFKSREKILPKLLYVRAFAELYNPQMAIYVLHELRKVYSDASLCMIGPDKDGNLGISKNLSKELGIRDAVEFTGLLSKAEWHQKSKEFDIFINTTNVDNTPTSVIESMALGLPVISTNVGGIPFLIDDKKDGILIEKNNVKAMVEAIQVLIEDNDMAKLISGNARKKVENFDAVEVGKLWKTILV